MTDLDTRDTTALESLAKKILTGAMRVTETSVYRFDLSGHLSDPAAFPSQPGDSVLGEKEGAGRGIKRVVILPLRRGGEEILDVVSVSCVIALPDGPGYWRIHAAAGMPWTVELAQQMIQTCLVDPDKIFDLTETLPFARVALIRGRNNVDELGVVSSGFHRGIGILAHGQSHTVARQHQRMLAPYAMQYRGLLRMGVHEDPDGRARKYYEDKEFTDLLDRPHEIAMPPLGGMRVVLPHDYPQSAIPKDLPLTLDKREAGDEKTVAAWLERCAALILHPKFAQDPTAHSVLDHLAPNFAADIAADKTLFIFQELMRTRESEDKLREQLRKFVAAGDELREHARQTQDMWEQQSRRTGEAERKVRELQAKLSTTQAKLAQVRGVDSGQLTARLASVEGERDQARAALAERVEDIDVLRETLLTLKQKPEAVVPRTWRELFPYARIFRYVDVPDWAVQPAYGVLDRGQESLGWLLRTWTVLVKMEEYASARAAGAEGSAYVNFRAYVSEYPASGVTPRHVVLGESEVVRTQSELRGIRTFPTPMGERFFQEHVRIGSSGAPPAPRLHYYDATVEIGKVLVGYVGPHLKNTRTN